MNDSDVQVWQDGYEAGFQAGHEVGYGSAHEEMAEAWRRAHETVQRHVQMNTHAELMKARGEYYNSEGVRCAA